MSTDDKRRTIGKVVFVSADKLEVELHRSTDSFTVVGFDDIHYVARLGSFIMIPVQAEYVVGEVVGLRDKDVGKQRHETLSETTIGAAHSVKLLDVIPIGMLPRGKNEPFRFGVSAFPSLYADALYILDQELDRIFEVDTFEEPISATELSEQGWSSGNDTLPPTRLSALSIGSSVIFKDYDVKVRINDFFGGHVAVLGNTGSGKSCTVATLLQSLYSKESQFHALGSTFIVLDVNGEYRKAFANLGEDVKRHYVSVPSEADPGRPEPWDKNERTQTFRLPHWFMSVEEWELLLRASERTQQPVLRTALGLTSLFAPGETEKLRQIRNHILASCIVMILEGDASTPTKADRIKSLLNFFYTDEINHELVRQHVGVSWGEMQNVETLGSNLKTYILEDMTLPSYENKPFHFSRLGEALTLALYYEEAHGNRQIRDFCAQMITRYNAIRDREDFSCIRVDPEDTTPIFKTMKRFVDYYLGITRVSGERKKRRQIVIVDMNDLSDEVIEVISSVLARMVFGRLRHADPRNCYPVTMILEEAHRYIADQPPRYAIDASRIFERISKEGRKYGLFLLLASQRPVEVSKTVLSQCANFVIHRIQNPDDLYHIRQMTPFISDSVLKKLPTLPKQHALIFGNSVNLPTTFRVRDVSPRPKSDDADISRLWYTPKDADALLS